MAVLARELVARGHDVTFFHHPDLAPRITSLNLRFVPVGGLVLPEGWLDSTLGHASRVRGMLGMRPLIREVARGTAMLCEELPEALRFANIDVIVCDELEPAGGMVAHHMGLPYVSVAAALPFNWEPGVPPPYVGWSFGDTRWHHLRNTVAQSIGLKLQAPLHEVVETYTKKWKLGPHRHVQHYASGFAQIAQLTPALDYPRRSLIGCFHYCGPFRDHARVATTNSAPRHRRRAFASLGSLQGHRFDIFDRIADAAATLDLDLTIAHGGRLSREEVKHLSGRADVRDFVSYEDVMQGADVAIMHGGMNGILDALALGVPVVVIPLAFEQAAIASRVRYSGVGLVCRSHTRRLADKIGKVVMEPSYALAASRLRAEIQASGGVRCAADITEHVAKTGRPCLNEDAVAADPSLRHCALA